jgi:MFS transporter, DHA2 family, multidrug resistance protein
MWLDPPTSATARTWAGLLVLLLPPLLTGMDASVLFVATAPIADALHPTATQWLWAMDIYSFVMAGLLITMGSLGDRIGSRKLLLIGAGVFGVASVVLAYAPTPDLLILARAVMATGGATLAPSTLSLVRSMFGDPRQRSTAVGMWTVAFAGGAVAGPIIAGVLLEHFWWGAVFLINVPVMLLILVTAPLLVAESKNPQQARFDLFGAAAALVAILSLVYALKHSARDGLDLSTCGAGVLGAAAATAFLIRQHRARLPLIDLALFRVPAFSTAIAISAIGAGVMSGLGALVFPFLQIVHGLTPLQSALWALPTFAGILAGASMAAALAGRYPAERLATAGLLAAAAGLGVVAIVALHADLWLFITAYTILTFGSGLTTTVATSVVLTSASPERAGTAAGISETSGTLGSALGIATFGTLAALIYRTTMTDNTPRGTDPAALETIGGAVATAHQSTNAGAAAVLGAADTAYTRGISTVAMVGAVLSVALAAVAAIVLCNRQHGLGGPRRVRHKSVARVPPDR